MIKITNIKKQSIPNRTKFLNHYKNILPNELIKKIIRAFQNLYFK